MIAEWLIKLVRGSEHKQFEVVKEMLRPYKLGSAYARPEGLSAEAWEAFREYEQALSACARRFLSDRKDEVKHG